MARQKTILWRIAWSAGLAVLILTIGSLAGWWGDRSRGPEEGVIFSEVAGAPENYLEREVTISGGISKVYSPFALSMGEAVLGHQLFVLARKEIPGMAQRMELRPPSEHEDVAQITGRIVEFDQKRLEAELGRPVGHLPIEDGTYVFLAESVRLRPYFAPPSRVAD